MKVDQEYQRKSNGQKPFIEDVMVHAHQVLSVEFADGESGFIFFDSESFSGVFENLKDTSFFRRVVVKDGLLTWPGELTLHADKIHFDIVQHQFSVINEIK